MSTKKDKILHTSVEAFFAGVDSHLSAFDTAAMPRPGQSAQSRRTKARQRLVLAERIRQHRLVYPGVTISDCSVSAIGFVIQDSEADPIHSLAVYYLEQNTEKRILIPLERCVDIKRINQQNFDLCTNIGVRLRFTQKVQMQQRETYPQAILQYFLERSKKALLAMQSA